MRVHRSWWVHAQHIHAVRKKGDAAVCVLSDGREVPISRRRKSDVLATLEQTANRDLTKRQLSEHSSQSQLN
jgi:DNA-binding LytR/AlgR family response regulator